MIQAEVILNHVNPNMRGIRQGEGEGQAYGHSAD
jgi:hypothetical protein